MQTLEEIQSVIANEPAVLLYFSAPTCNVCYALKPKLFAAVKEQFEKMEIICIDIEQTPEIAAGFSVFTIPTVLVFLDSKEFIRKSRNMSVEEFIQEVKRPYDIFFS